MELKVWVEGIQRIVCGVTDTTTCQDVVYALAHATGKTGRFTLIERWRNSERLLAPHEHPLKILLKWGEYASDVQFILQRTALEPRPEVKPDKVTPSHQFYGKSGIQANSTGLQSHGIMQKSPVSIVDSNLGKTTPNSPPQNRDIKKSLTFSGGHSSHLSAQVNHEVLNSSPEVKGDKHVTQEATSSSISSVGNHIDSSPGKVVVPSSHSSNYKNTSPLKMSPALSSNNDTVCNSVSGDINDNMLCSVSSSLDKNIKNHLRDSPVSNLIQRSSPLKGVDGERSYVKDMIKQLVKDSSKEQSSHAIFDHKSEQVVVDNYYRELVRLVNKQREKISAQQIDLTKYEAEIAFTEGYCKEEESRLNYIKSEILRLENVPDDIPDSPVNKLSIEELELSLKEAHTSEALAIEDVTTIKKKISNYDQQLNQMMSKIRIIQDALEHEELLQKQMQSDLSQGEEQGAILREIEKLQAAVNQASNQADHAHEVSLQLSQELNEADARLLERKKEIDKLKISLREANMEALTMTPAEELKALSENRTGIAKNGTSRRMKGSPRQLETAVPTSKNPHGVWV